MLVGRKGIVSLQLAPSVGKACALAQVAVESTHGQAEVSGISSVSGDI